MLDYKLIEALAMVVREGGFEKAAKALYITQSAVSQRMRLLEEQLGQVLLSRTTPPRPTPAGKKLLKHYLQVRHLESDLTGEMSDTEETSFSSVSVGINADTLATWFPDAISSFLAEENVLLDIRVDDQDQTHRFLKDGTVIGCISTREAPMQGCRCDYIGQMTYRMAATREYAGQWFPGGLSPERVGLAPAIIFNRKDTLHQRLLSRALGSVADAIPTHCIPSSEKFVDFIRSGIGYGMMPDQQCAPLFRSGCLIDLAPGQMVPVKLYWHRWNLRSALLDKLSKCLITNGKTLLAKEEP